MQDIVWYKSLLCLSMATLLLTDQTCKASWFRAKPAEKSQSSVVLESHKQESEAIGVGIKLSPEELAAVNVKSQQKQAKQKQGWTAWAKDKVVGGARVVGKAVSTVGQAAVHVGKVYNDTLKQSFHIEPTAESPQKESTELMVLPEAEKNIVISNNDFRSLLPEAKSNEALASSQASFYDVLGVSKTATPDDIKRAYRRLALKQHPDKNLENSEAATLALKKINAAYGVLSDPQKRTQYDQASRVPDVKKEVAGNFGQAAAVSGKTITSAGEVDSSNAESQPVATGIMGKFRQKIDTAVGRTSNFLSSLWPTRSPVPQSSSSSTVASTTKELALLPPVPESQVPTVQQRSLRTQLPVVSKSKEQTLSIPAPVSGSSTQAPTKLSSTGTEPELKKKTSEPLIGQSAVDELKPEVVQVAAPAPTQGWLKMGQGIVGGAVGIAKNVAAAVGTKVSGVLTGYQQALVPGPKVEPIEEGVPKSLNEQLQDHVAAALSNSQKLEQARVDGVIQQRGGAVLNILKGPGGGVGVRAFRNHVVSNLQDTSISYSESQTMRPDAGAVAHRLFTHLHSVVTQDSMKASGQSSGLAGGATGTFESLPLPEQHLHAALGVAQKIEQERVDNNKTIIVKPLRNLRVRLGQALPSIVSSALVKVGVLLKADDPSVSHSEALNNKSDLVAAHNTLREVAMAQVAKPVSLEPETQKEVDVHAAAVADAVKAHQAVDQLRVQEATSTFKSKPNDGFSLSRLVEAVKASTPFKNTRQKLFGYDPTDTSMSFSEAWAQQPDSVAVINRAHYQTQQRLDSLKAKYSVNPLVQKTVQAAQVEDQPKGLMQVGKDLLSTGLQKAKEALLGKPLELSFNDMQQKQTEIDAHIQQAVSAQQVSLVPQTATGAAVVQKSIPSAGSSVSLSQPLKVVLDADNVTTMAGKQTGVGTSLQQPGQTLPVAQEQQPLTAEQHLTNALTTARDIETNYRVKTLTGVAPIDPVTDHINLIDQMKFGRNTRVAWGLKYPILNKIGIGLPIDHPSMSYHESISGDSDTMAAQNRLRAHVSQKESPSASKSTVSLSPEMQKAIAVSKQAADRVVNTAEAAEQSRVTLALKKMPDALGLDTVAPAGIRITSLVPGLNVLGDQLNSLVYGASTSLTSPSASASEISWHRPDASAVEARVAHHQTSALDAMSVVKKTT